MKHRDNLITLLLLLAILPWTGSSSLAKQPNDDSAHRQMRQTGSLVGVLVDSLGRHPLVGIGVSVTSLSRWTTLTDSLGRFCFDGLPAGIHALGFMSMNYGPRHVAQIKVSSGGHVDLGVLILSRNAARDNANLRKDDEDRFDLLSCPLPPVTVKAQRNEIKLDQAGQCLHVPADGFAVDNSGAMHARSGGSGSGMASYQPSAACQPAGGWNTEEYQHQEDNGFRRAAQDPLSTFSVDVDVASYGNLRRHLNGGHLPPADAVRTEELLNYFTYQYPEPEAGAPFSVSTELAAAPWALEHRLLLVGLQGRHVPVEQLPPCNLVFLVDVSGSMKPENKLPLVQSSLRLLARQLRPQDRIALVVYAGSAGLVLPSTPGCDKAAILTAINHLSAGGSTAGGAGLQLAYQVAEEGLIIGGTNRIVWATDGDFNVGVSSTGELVRLVEEKRQGGVSLSLLGFGMGNLKDSRLEQLADKGDGNYAYIDNHQEARRVLVGQMAGTLYTIAKDVKLQVEFNPAAVQAYRLIGYENRLLASEDFADDTKDAGEIGAGHSVTALYEIVPVGVPFPGQVEALKYQDNELTPRALSSGELATLSLRYKDPGEVDSRLLARVIDDRPVALDEASANLRFASSVAELGLLLRDSPHKGGASFTALRVRANAALAFDPEGYRAEFDRLAGVAQDLAAALPDADRLPMLK